MFIRLKMKDHLKFELSTEHNKHFEEIRITISCSPEAFALDLLAKHLESVCNFLNLGLQFKVNQLKWIKSACELCWETVISQSSNVKKCSNQQSKDLR